MYLCVAMVFFVFSRDSWGLESINTHYIGISHRGTLGAGYIQLSLILHMFYLQEEVERQSSETDGLDQLGMLRQDLGKLDDPREVFGCFWYIYLIDPFVD